MLIITCPHGPAPAGGRLWAEQSAVARGDQHGHLWHRHAHAPGAADHRATQQERGRVCIRGAAVGDVHRQAAVGGHDADAGLPPNNRTCKALSLIFLCEGLRAATGEHILMTDVRCCCGTWCTGKRSWPAMMQMQGCLKLGATCDTGSSTVTPVSMEDAAALAIPKFLHTSLGSLARSAIHHCCEGHTLMQQASFDIVATCGLLHHRLARQGVVCPATTLKAVSCGAADHLPRDHPEQVPRVPHQRAGVGQKHRHPVHEEGSLGAAHNEGGGGKARRYQPGQRPYSMRSFYTCSCYCSKTSAAASEAYT